MKDGVCFFDDFEKQIEREGTYNGELDTIQARMMQISNLQTLPKEKFKDITPGKDAVKEYEIKTKNLRVYLIKDVHGSVVVLGGKKANQKSDIKKFRNLKKGYLESRT
ncbi:MAG: hypothetical protein NTV87_15845 [Ignavibacteriae bacterium]|nr:hypothetical protein [Ignavibacteriota bacterium]